MTSVVCGECKATFEPRAGGYNARYCGARCRNKARRTRIGSEKRNLQHRQRFVRVKQDVSRYGRHLQQGRRSRRAVREWLAEYKLKRGCIDCGYAVHFAALQLDHTGPKGQEIADCRSSIARLQEEIQQGRCVVRCANCHSVKTWADKNGLTYVVGMKSEMKDGDQGAD